MSLGLRDNRKCIPVAVAVPAAATLGSSLISSIGSLISGSKTNKTQLQIARETNAQQMQMFQQQMDYNRAAESRARQYAIEDFNMENAYNSPAAQKQRYIDAGLNPYLMMSGDNASVGQMESTSGAQAPGAPQLNVPEVQDYVSPALDRMVSGMGQTINAVLQAEQAAGLASDNRVKRATETQRILQERLENDKRIEQLKSMKFDPKIKEMEIKNLEKQNEILDHTITLNAVTFDSQVKSQKTLNYLNDRLADKYNQEAIAQQIRNEFLRSREILEIGVLRKNIDALAAQAAELMSRVGVNRSMAAYQVLMTVGEGLVPGTRQFEKAQEAIDNALKKQEKELRQMGQDYWNPFHYIGGFFGAGANYSSGSSKVIRVVK